ERLRHDRAVVVVLRLEPRRELVEAETGGDRERADVVAPGAGRSDVVREAAIGARVAVGGLLPEEREAGAAVVIVDNDIVAVGRRRPEAVDTPRRDQPVADDLVEERLRVVEELARGGLGEERRVAALDLPGVEEELPVDVLAQGLERRLDDSDARERRHIERVELDGLAVRARGGDREERLAIALGVLVAQAV